VSSHTETFDALGVTVAAINPPKFLAILDAWHKDSPPADTGAFVTFRDVHGVVRAWDDPELAAAHATALINAPDGKPLVWIGRRRGFKNMAQVCGPDMFPEVCRFGVSRGWRHVLYGSTPEVLSRLKAQLNKVAPGVQIVDTISPPFRPLTAAENDEMVERIRASNPHFVWVGIGTPKQEIWMARNAPHLPGAICMGVGGAFDMHSDAVPRAATWIRMIGLEWLSRAMSEPRRLGPRYAKVVPRFIWWSLLSEIGLARPPISVQSAGQSAQEKA
jgi:N-acetylglucosaminyldiphosphoundecaprenol N-acetyl-beta-D-mannosaminyltransferase